MIRTQIQLTESQAREVKRMAEERGVSMAAIIREAIDDRLRRRNAPSRDEIVERAIAAVGTCSSGRGDAADRHDEYFAESGMEWEDQ